MNTTLKNETADIYDKVICVTNRHLCKESLPKQWRNKTFRCTMDEIIKCGAKGGLV